VKRADRQIGPMRRIGPMGKPLEALVRLVSLTFDGGGERIVPGKLNVCAMICNGIDFSCDNSG
jgi:hypothetical protein